MKRIVDLVLALITLSLLSLPMLFLAGFIYQRLGTPIFFRQTRPGLQGKPFKILKFKSMKEAYDVDGNLLPDNKRLTNFGIWLRSTSLDELPELWNVIKGEMSLVGPRPLLMEYLPLYTTDQARRHEVRPGITGWAQVNGRNAISWEEKFKLDVWYVDNQSLWLDIKILWLTVNEVLKRDGISAAGEATMHAFKRKSSQQQTEHLK